MAKKKQAKLPRTVAGVKVPKPLRSAGGAILRAAKNPVVLDLAVAALAAAAATLQENRKNAGKRSVARAALGAAVGATVKASLRAKGGKR